MGLKQKLGMGVMSAALGIALIGGGTYAYFSDSVEATSTFAAGTMDLTFNQPTGNGKNVIFDLDNIKPGDTQQQSFSLENNGTLDFSKVLLDTDYSVEDAKGDNDGEDFGKYINVKFFLNTTKGKRLIENTTLDQLANGDALDVLGGEGLAAGGEHYENFYVQVEFVDNGEDQNKFQGDSLTLDWTFTAEQTTGDEK